MATSSDHARQFVSSFPGYDEDVESFNSQLDDLPSVDLELHGDSDDALDTDSLRASIFNYVWENGRSYHRYNEGSYFLPNDADEIERLDLQYIILKIVMGERDHLAPLKKPRKILDIGTATGIWCIEMAKKFPDAEVTGTDLSAIQTPAPENVRWLVEDAEKDSWGTQKYDYIHSRMMLGAFEDFEGIIKKAYDYLEPGGWMECQELWNYAFCADGTMPADYKLNEWAKYQDEAAMIAGRPLRIANKLAGWYKRNGFVDVREQVFHIPIGPFLNEGRAHLIGKFWAKQLSEGLFGFSAAYFTRFLGWSMAELQAYLAGVRNDLHKKGIHAFHKFYVVCGRKPTLQEMAASKGASSSASAPRSGPSASSSTSNPSRINL